MNEAPNAPLRKLDDKELADLMRNDPPRARNTNMEDLLRVSWAVGPDVPAGTVCDRVEDKHGRYFAIAITPDDNIIAGYEMLSLN